MSVVTVTITSEGDLMDPIYELRSLDIIKEVNRIPYAQVILRDGDAAKQIFEISDTDFFLPGKTIEIKLRYEDKASEEATVFKGLVVRHGVEAGGQGSLLTVECKDAAVALTAGRKSKIFRDQTDDKIIGQIVAAAGLTKGKMAATQPAHAELVQYACTDWDFILSRADVQGLLVVVDEGTVALQEIVLDGQPKQTFEYGISEIHNFEMQADASHQFESVQSIAWDVKAQKLTGEVKAKAFSLEQGDLKGDQIAKKLGATACTLTSPTNLDQKELQAWADAKMKKSRMSLLRGRISVPGDAAIKPMDLIEIKGIGKRFNGKTLVTGVRHQVNTQGWQTDVQFGLSADWFSQNEDIVEAPAAGLLPGVNGLQIGKVAAFEADPDAAYRVKVILPGVDEKEGAVWARLAAPDAGPERGWFFRPEPDDEVVVGFLNDDPRQPVILGALYSAAQAPSFVVDEANLEKAIVTRQGTTIGFIDDEKASVFIETPAANKILLSDDQEMVQLSDQHGNVITLNADGVTIKSAKDVIIDASGNVEIKGAKVDVK